MATSRKLKVFRTAIGFHDAYVATPSKKAALEAWGAGKDLVAIGSAEQVTDAKLMAAALAHPGEVIKFSRGSTAEHLQAAAQGARAGTARLRSPDPSSSNVPTKPSRPKARPSRQRLDRAERELDEFEATAKAALSALLDKEAELARQRAAIEADLAKTRKDLEQKLGRARTAHEDALARWRANS